MLGFYSLWVQPYCKEKGLSEYEMQDYDFLTMILSVLKWQEKNGPAMLLGDDMALAYLNQWNLEHLFSEGFSSLTVPGEINPKIFWAAGKMCAFHAVKAPATMIDLDLIIWEDLNPIFSTVDGLVIHKEDLRPEVYPDFRGFSVKESYSFPESWDQSVLPANTAMLYLRDQDFKNFYTEESIRFMKASTETHDKLCPMVFAEQRLLSILAKEKNRKIECLFPLMQNIGKQNLVTHTWGHKNIMKYNYEERMRFCVRVLNRIKNDFPDTFEELKIVPFLATYFQELEK